MLEINSGAFTKKDIFGKEFPRSTNDTIKTSSTLHQVSSENLLEQTGKDELVVFRCFVSSTVRVSPMLFDAFLQINSGQSTDSIPNRSDAMMRLVSRVESYGELKDNWDFDGAQAPHQQVISDVLVFLENIPNDLPLPSPEVGIEGEVAVCWKNKKSNVRVDAVFYGDGSFEFFGVHQKSEANRELYGGDKYHITKPWPRDMLRLLHLK